MRSYTAIPLLLLPLALSACAAGPLRAAPSVPHPAHSQGRRPPVTASGFPRPQAYKLGTPERTLAEFLIAWHGKDFTRMAQLTHLTWRLKDPNPAKTLRKEFTPIPVVGASIGGVAHGQFLPIPSENIKNLSVTIRYRSDTGLHTKTVAAVLYRESRPFHQSTQGTWGVNPDFTLNLDD